MSKSPEQVQEGSEHVTKYLLVKLSGSPQIVESEMAKIGLLVVQTMDMPGITSRSFERIEKPEKIIKEKD
jgi:hypothetical protein